MTQCESLWLWRGDNSGIREGERPPLETDTRGLVKGQETKKTQCVCDRLCEIAIALHRLLCRICTASVV
jgi:hypothetical protein